MNIRPITTEDAPAVAELSRQLGYVFSTEETRLAIERITSSGSDAAFVALDEQRVIGWIHVFYTVRLESAPFCEIGGMVVDEQYRGRGVGKQLIAGAELWCADKGINKLRVRSNTKRGDAHRFYLNAGFNESKEQKVFEKHLRPKN